MIQMNAQKLYDQAYHWILTYGPRILAAIIILFIGLWFIRFLKKWLRHHLFQREVNSSIRPFLINVIVIISQALLIIALMQIIGLQMTIFTAVVGAFGVAAGLALSGTLQNFTSGILILLLKPFRVGDNIVTQGMEGTVTSIQIFYTVVLTFDNRTVIVPNSKLSNDVILNLSREGKRRFDLTLKFNFASPFDQVKQIIDRTVGEVEHFLTEPVHRVGIISIEPDGYKVEVNVWVPAHGFRDSQMAFQEKLIDNFKAAGVKLPGM